MDCIKKSLRVIIVFDRSAPRKPRLLRRGRGELYEIEKILTGKLRPLGGELHLFYWVVFAGLESAYDRSEQPFYGTK